MGLTLENVVKEFQLKSGMQFRAVDGVSLDLSPGKFHTLLGPSGCGKTTLLRMIAGFETPTQGRILHRERDISQVPAHERGFPMVFQSYALFPHLTVEENVAYGLKVRKVPREEIRKRLDKILKLLDLEANLGKHPAQLSGGQQQRVALARALVLEPEIILFDEPLSNLDAKLRVTMRDEIRSVQKRVGITAIYVTHDQEEAMAISDQIVILNKGKVEQAGAPLDIYRKPVSEFVARFLGSANVVLIARPGGEIMGQRYEIPASAKSVVIRAESLKISRGQGRHSAIIENAIFLGGRTHYQLTCNGEKLSADVPLRDDAVFDCGEQVAFDLDLGQLHFLG